MSDKKVFGDVNKEDLQELMTIFRNLDEETLIKIYVKAVEDGRKSSGIE